jgi:hypothetical protein
MLLAVLPERKTGGKDTVLSSSFAYTWNRLKRYRHACCMGRLASSWNALNALLINTN